MTRLRRIVLLRHGETQGNSSERFHGAGDVPLSEEGEAQVRAALRGLCVDAIDRVVSSPLQRAWQSARIVAPGRSIVLEDGFREIDFGRWEGLNAQEIQVQDPVLYTDWRARAPGFDYPDGERRADFRARVDAGLTRLLESGVASVLVVAHKGVVRTILEALGAVPELPADRPALGEPVQATQQASGRWRVGARSSNPAGLD